MKIFLIAAIVVLESVGCLCFADNNGPPKSREENNVAIVPEFDKSTAKNGRVALVFKIKNNTTADIAIYKRISHALVLMTHDDLGRMINIENLRQPMAMLVEMGPWESVVLKPGESQSFVARASLEDLVFAAIKHKQIFGVIEGVYPATKQEFYSFSNLFSIPPEWIKASN